MGCGCGGRNRVTDDGNIAGFVLITPAGERIPPASEPPFMSQVEAQIEQRKYGGGTVRSIPK